MPEAGLAEPLLQRTDAPLPTHNATQLEVFRQSGSQLIVRSKDGHVQYHLHKRGAYNPFGGLDWHLADATGTKGSHLRVRRKAMSSQTTFCTLRGDVTSATLDHELGDYYCDLHWDLATYRWELAGPCVPALLRLVNTTTRQVVAQLQGSTFFPWSKQPQQRITVLSGQKDALWLQIVVTSGLAEAERLNVANSWTAPMRWAM